MSPKQPMTGFEDRLVSHSARVRSFAHSLTADAALAEDIAQEAIIQALLHGAEDHPQLGAWLARTVRNRLYQEYRSAARRRRRETLVVAAESSDGDVDRLAREEMVESLRQAVMGLEEPYRTTVILRYFHELTPSGVAEQMRVPVKTVQTRLTRGLARLRERLGRRGDRQSTRWAMVGVFGRHGTPGRLLSSMALRVVAAVLAVTLVGVSVFRLQEISPTQVALARAVLAPAVTSPPALHSPATATRIAPGVEPPPVATSVFHGIVIDTDGVPLRGARIVYRELELRLNLGQAFTLDTGDLLLPSAADHHAISDGAGRFRIAVPTPPSAAEPRRSTGGFPLLEFNVRQAQERSGALFALAEGCVPLFVALVDAHDLALDHHLVVAQRGVVTGVVIDDNDVPQGGCGIAWDAPEHLRERLGVPLSSAFTAVPSGEADPRGRFTMDAVPLIDGAVLCAVRGREQQGTVAVPLAPRSDVLLRLQRLPATRPAVFGHLLGAAGEPVSWGAVTDGANVAIADANGDYRLEFVHPSLAPRLTAIARGLLPAYAPLPAVDAREELCHDFVLDRPPLRLAGMVVDEDGRALAGVRVGIDEMTPLWDGVVETPVCVEHVLERRGPEVWIGSLTDDFGRFEIVGLAERTYHLTAAEERGPRFARLGPVDAGRQDVVITLRCGDALPPLTGRVIDLAGEPIAGVEIRATRQISTLPRPDDRAPLRVTMSLGTECRTDARGVFRLVCDDLSGLRFTARAAGYIATEWPAEAVDRQRAGDRMLARACGFRVDARAAVVVPVRFCLVDASGEPLTVEVRRGAWSMPATWVPIAEGFSEEVTAPENACHVRLRHAAGGDLEQPIELRPGETTTLRL